MLRKGKWPWGIECSGAYFSASQIVPQLLWSVEIYHEDVIHVTTLENGFMD
jgi:hypothetical protein